MGCHAPAEDVEEDDRQFLAAAREDATLVAHLLLLLSRSEASSSPWRQLWDPASPSAGAGENDLPLPDPPKWGQRRPRSRCLTSDGIPAAKREEARRSSPTTPLSWSGGGGGSWTSGSMCESTPPARPPKRRKQPDSASGHDVVEPSAASALANGLKPEPREDWGHGPAPPREWKKTEAACKGGSPRGAFVAVAPAAVGSASSPGSTKAVAAAAAAAVGVPPRAVAHVEPLRLRLTGERTSSVPVRRPGKKKTVPELKALNESLLQEQVELRKDLEEQKKIFEALFEENIRLKNLESSLAFDKVGEPTVNSAAHREAESEEPQQPQDVKESSTAADHPQQVLPCTNPPNSAPQRALFDLNCPPDDGFL